MLSKLAQFPHIYIVEASAGSGKTYTLAKRYIQLLSLGPQEASLNTILAITFTNKSAIEMKERIMEFLKRIALDKFHTLEEKKDILYSLAVDEESARKKAYKIMDGLIRNYNFFQVETIDSFINSILSACSFKLGLSANFKTEKNYNDYLAYGLDRLIDRIIEDKGLRMVFEGFIKQYLYIDNRTSWFPKQNIFFVVSRLFSKSNKYAKPFMRNDINAADIIALKKDILKLMYRLQINLPEGTMISFAKSLNNFLLQNKDGFNIDNLSEFFKRKDFPAKKGWELNNTAVKLWADIREAIVRLCVLESASMFNCYIDIFNGVLFELKEICAREDVLFLDALNKQACVLLDDLGLPELYCRLSTVFKHFLIDEFQDTSCLQWNNLFIMVEEALATRGSLFYVGDRKQAIYRFRGGESALIDSVKEHFNRIGIIQESLTKNYRSQKEIVEFNNTVFSTDNLRRFLNEREMDLDLEHPDIEGIIKVFEGSRQSYRSDKNAGYVKLEFIDYKTKADRDIILKEKLVSVIQEAAGRLSLNSIALLVRKNDDIELLTTWLLENGIPVASEKTLNIRDNSYIKELVSFLKFLSSPIDSLSFASFILGDIFLKAASPHPTPLRGERVKGEEGDAEINRKDIQEFIFEFNRERKEEAYLYREFRSKFPEIWDGLIEEFFKNVGFIPFYELVVTILGKFNVAVNFSGYQGFFMKFLELIKENEEDKFSITAFLEFFENADSDQLYVNFDRNNAVKILTIHKAKGLEFPVVIIPFLEVNIKVDNEVIKEEKEQLKLMYLKKEYADYCPDLAYEYKQQCLKSLVDELNSIYVALTRAIDELYIFVPVNPKKNLNLAKFLFNDIFSSPLAPTETSGLVGEGGGEGIPFYTHCFERGGKAECSQPNDKEEIIIDIPASEYKDWITLLKDEFIDKHILEAKEVIHKGQILHFVLSLIGNTHNQDTDKLVKQAIEKMRLKSPDTVDFSGPAGIVNNLLKEKKLRDYFDIVDGEVYLEKEIVDSYGNTRRIDRLIVTEKEVIVVDYKSSRLDREVYHKQVAEYMSIVGDVYPGLDVRGVLVYLDDLSCEDVEPESCIRNG